MRELPDALAPLGAYSQFILCKLVPSTTKPGKMEKLPIDWRSGAVASAHDSSIWMAAPQALMMAEQYGPQYLPCFVFTERDPFWFLDIDSCVLSTPAGPTWSPVAQHLCNYFRGCAIERSTSGIGLHVFGQGVVPAHRTRPPAEINAQYPGLEFYTSGRFVALTGDILMPGSAGVDTTLLMAPFVAAWFAGGERLTPADWTTEPVPEWRGPTDDAELLRRAMNSKSGKSAFGDQPTFADLWTANAEVLGRKWPDTEKGRPFDPTRADAALAQLLAFWTGKNCARIERLMRQSALVRDKWDYHATYLNELTIAGCVARQTQVLQDKPPEASPLPAAVDYSAYDDGAAASVQLPVDRRAGAPAAPSAAPGLAVSAPRQRRVTGTTFLSPDDQEQLFAGCVYIRNENKVLVPGGKLLDSARFNVVFGGYKFVLGSDNAKMTSKAWEAFTESQILRAPMADDTCFRPELDPGVLVETAGVVEANIWWPISTPRQQGDVTPLLHHMNLLIADERDRWQIICYIAAMIQYPGRKFMWAPLIQGVAGNGKTVISLIVAKALGARYVHWPEAGKLKKDFNFWLKNKLAYLIEDIYVKGGEEELLEKLKPMITSTEGYEVEPKGVDQVIVRIVGNFIFNTNHLGGLPKTADDRRLAPFHCRQQHVDHLERDGLDGAYFRVLYDWLENKDGYAICHDYLATLQIPDHFNPALRGRAPNTASTADAIAYGRSPFQQEIDEAIGQGLAGFCGGWISSIALDRLIERKNLRVSYRKRGEVLESMGFIRHPTLTDGRTGSMVSPDNGKPRLFIRKDSPAISLATGVAVEKAYSDAQGVFQQR